MFSSCFFSVYPGLPAQAELGDERAVALDVLFLEVLEQPATPADQLEQTPPRVEIVLVLAQVLREVRYAPRQHRDLYLGRPRVVLVRPVLLDDRFFMRYYSQLLLSPLCSLL
jgi:hypothetical protein